MFERPSVVVCGATHYDQRWIDENVEAGIGAFGWERPKPRPQSLGPCRPAPAARAPAPKKKPTVIQRLKARVSGAPAIEPVPYVGLPAESTVTVEPPARAAAVRPPARVDPLDDLLGPMEHGK